MAEGARLRECGCCVCGHAHDGHRDAVVPRLATHAHSQPPPVELALFEPLLSSRLLVLTSAVDVAEVTAPLRLGLVRLLDRLLLLLLERRRVEQRVWCPRHPVELTGREEVVGRGPLENRLHLLRRRAPVRCNRGVRVAHQRPALDAVLGLVRHVVERQWALHGGRGSLALRHLLVGLRVHHCWTRVHRARRSRACV